MSANVKDWGYQCLLEFSMNRTARSYRRKVRITFNNPLTEEGVITELAGIGFKIGEVLPENPNARVSEINGAMVGQDKLTWDLVVTFETNGETDDNPLNQPAEISLDFESYQMRIERDVDGNAILMSSTERPDEPVERDDSRPILTITRNEASSNWAGLALDYHDCVNTDQFWVAGPNQAKVKSIKGNNFYYNGLQYWKVSYVIELRRETWTKKILDAGYAVKFTGFKLNDKGKMYNRIVHVTVLKNADGTPVDKPHLLDGNGQKLPEGANPVFKDWNVYERRPFSALHLPV